MIVKAKQRRRCDLPALLLLMLDWKRKRGGREEDVWRRGECWARESVYVNQTYCAAPLWLHFWEEQRWHITG